MKPVQFRLSTPHIIPTQWLCLLMLSSVLLGCSGTSGKAPIVDRSYGAKQRQANAVTSGQHVVQRGTNENINRMIRRWIPKGDDIGLYSDQEIKQIQDWINDYPRKIFGGLSSNQYKKLFV